MVACRLEMRANYFSAHNLTIPSSFQRDSSTQSDMSISSGSPKRHRHYKHVAMSYFVFQTISEVFYAEFFKRYQNNIASKFQRSSFLVFAQLFDLTEKRSLICGSWCYVYSAFLLTTLWDTRDVVRILKLKSLKLCMRKSNKSRINTFSHSLFSHSVASPPLISHSPVT